VTRLLIRRVITAIFVLWGVSVITFAMARLVPSDPAVLYIGENARKEDVERVTRELGFDRPLPEQYVLYVRGLLTGNWGNSIATKRPVLSDIALRFPATLELMISALIIAVVTGVLLGVTAALRQHGLIDSVVRVISVAAVAVPGFWLGLLFQIVFFRELGVLPLTGRLDGELEYGDRFPPVTGMYVVDSLVAGDWTALSNTLWHLVLPALTLAAHATGILARMTRSAMLDVMSQDYIRTARSYGLPARTIALKLAFKNALPPVLAILGLIIANMLTGAFFVEVIFGWPGLGLYGVHALLALDYPAVMGITMFGAVGFVVVNFVVDLLQGWIDPRIRMA
jgi:peptide/nickel transport system permease protein